ncbi:hypothetical protein ACFL0T_02460 [Candidatus Omnitrophota bacterium]
MENTSNASSANPLDIGRCFRDAMDVYKGNILMLALATLIYIFGMMFSVFTLFIILGPLYGGYCLMMLNAMRKEDKRVELSDFLKIVPIFWPLVGLFALQTLLIFCAAFALIIPALILATLWMYSILFMIDENIGVVDSMKASWNLVKECGFWINIALLGINVLISTIPAQIPLIQLIAWVFVTPFAALLLTSAYMQQHDKPVVTHQPEIADSDGEDVNQIV